MTTLLTLPGEIRDQIWAYATFPASDTLYFQSGKNEKDMVRSFARFSVFRICVQIRNEALAYLFKTRNFFIYGSHSTLAFCRWAGVHAQQNLRSLTVRFMVLGEFDDLDEHHVFYRELKKLRSLTRLVFILDSPTPSARKLVVSNQSVEDSLKRLEAWKVFQEMRIKPPEDIDWLHYEVSVMF